VKIRCMSCGTVYNRPPGTIQQINAGYHCDRCGASNFIAVGQPGGNGALAGGVGGAVVGAAIGGPPGAVVGALLGFLLGGGNGGNT
jgi:DNA-directed RNA polymerase subunit RPC12/RpoP